MSRPKRIVVGIAGASGVTYGIRLLECLQETDYETHLIISEAGKLNIEIETEYKAEDVAGMADVVYDHKNVAAGPSSGSFLTEGMVVVPCTVKTLSGIATIEMAMRDLNIDIEPGAGVAAAQDYYRQTTTDGAA